MNIAIPVESTSEVSNIAPELGQRHVERRAAVEKWKKLVALYQEPSRWRACWQICNTFGIYVALWIALYWAKDVSWLLALPLAVLAGGFLIRIFIIFHDCGHGSFFRSHRANQFWGFLAGLLTFTPFYHWRWEHAQHHSTTGDLDRRGIGDVWTMTVEEYLSASRWKRFYYRLFRHPFMLIMVAPLVLFLVLSRFPSPKATRRDRRSVWWSNLCLALMVVGMSLIYGTGAYIVLQLTAMIVAGSAGVWLFYVQHQFEDAYWERGENWDYTEAALKGSSFYKLPRILQWFSGNIGFHHIHHLSPRIPNYNLERCHRSDPMFHATQPLTLRSSLKLLRLRLWDEASRKLISFRHLRRARRAE